MSEYYDRTNPKPDSLIRVLPTAALTVLMVVVSAVGADAPSAPPVASLPVVAKPAAEPADNSFCYVCHRNFEKETLNVAHTKQGIGCEQCHGISERHSADEDGITPPEIMYAQARVNPACMKCHSVEQLQKDNQHRSLLDRLKEGSPSIAKPAKADAESVKSICTDCHGQHRLKVRTRIWDKDNGKLLKDDGVRMMDQSRPGKR